MKRLARELDDVKVFDAALRGKSGRRSAATYQRLRKSDTITPFSPQAASSQALRVIEGHNKPSFFAGAMDETRATLGVDADVRDHDRLRHCAT